MVFIEGVIIIIDINMLYKDRKNGNLIRKDFIELVIKWVIEVIFVGGLVVVGGLLFGLFGVIVGIVGGFGGKVVGFWFGFYIGWVIMRFIKMYDKVVIGIIELKIGDYIVLYSYFVYLRYYCIVLWYDGKFKVNVIYNMYCDGVK